MEEEVIKGKKDIWQTDERKGQTETQMRQLAKNKNTVFMIIVFFQDILVSTLFKFYKKHSLQ